MPPVTQSSTSSRGAWHMVQIANRRRMACWQTSQRAGESESAAACGGSLSVVASKDGTAVGTAHGSQHGSCWLCHLWWKMPVLAPTALPSVPTIGPDQSKKLNICLPVIYSPLYSGLTEKG